MTLPEPSAGHFVGKTHFLPIRVYYEDTDFSGIVYHANYLRYLERGRSDFLRLSGISHTELRQSPQPIAFAVIHMDLSFRKSAGIDDAVVVRTHYEPLKGVRFLARQTILRGEDVILEAAVQAVCIDLDGRPRRPPPAVADRLHRWFTAAPATITP